MGMKPPVTWPPPPGNSLRLGVDLVWVARAVGKDGLQRGCACHLAALPTTRVAGGRERRWHQLSYCGVVQIKTRFIPRIEDDMACGDFAIFQRLHIEG